MDPDAPDIWIDGEPPLVILAHPDPAVRGGVAVELEDFEVLEVGDGREVLSVVEEREPCAVIASCQLPGIGGVELCRRLRDGVGPRWMPIALTTKFGDDVFEEAREAGAAEVVAIPFSPMELRMRMHNMVRGAIYQREVERKDSVILEALNDLRESEAMLVHAEKLSVLGEMMAGIVHEINNPLNYSKSALFVLQRMCKDMDEGEEREEFEDLIGDVTEGLERVGLIIQDLRTFATKGTVEVEDVDLYQVVQTAARLLGNKLNNLQYVENVPEGLLVQGNENNLCQVLLNLIKNGVEATEEAGRRLDESEIRITGEESARGVALRIRDNGCGIPQKARGTMFEPFFTSKDRGSGMGLGLSICRRIIEDHGASIAVESEPGEYTEFVLSFPPLVENEPPRERAGEQPKLGEALLDHQS